MDNIEMPHPDHPLVDRGYLYHPGTWQSDWYQERYDRLQALVAERRAANPRPATDWIAGFLGGDSRYYLTEAEANALAEAADQVDFAERIRARGRVAAKRAARLAGREP